MLVVLSSTVKSGVDAETAGSDWPRFAWLKMKTINRTSLSSNNTMIFSMEFINFPYASCCQYERLIASEASTPVNRVYKQTHMFVLPLKTIHKTNRYQ